MARLKLSPPWVIFYSEVDAMFKNDDDVMVVYDEEENEIKLYVEGEEKAGAMSELLPTEKQFGNVTLKVTVVPANGLLLNQKVSDAYRAMFEGNSAVDYIEDVEGVFSNDLHYVVFAKEVVQYFTDDLGDAHGVRSTLYQEIAKDIFENQDGVYFCTNTEDDPYAVFNF